MPFVDRCHRSPEADGSSRVEVTSLKRKNWIFFGGVLVLLALLAGCGPAAAPSTSSPGSEPGAERLEPPPDEAPAFSYAGRLIDARPYLALQTWTWLLEEQGWATDWLPMDRVAVSQKEDLYVRFTDGVPVAERSGVFVPLSSPPRSVSDANGDPVLWIPVSALEEIFGWHVDTALSASDPDTGGAVSTTPGEAPGVAEMTYVAGSSGGESPGEVPAPGAEVTVTVTPAESVGWSAAPELSLTAKELAAYLSFLKSPLTGAQAGFADTQVPGAPREYRNGLHEGFDWYGYAVGVPVNRETPVLAMAAGTVVRAGHDWRTPSAEVRQRWLDIAAASSHTPEWILDRLRGRQVWIMHENGVLVRFAHLDSIPEDLQVGQKVAAGDVIGYVGNSGTSSEVKGTDGDLHLHSDILVYGRNPWQSLDAGQNRDIMAAIIRTEPET